MKHADLEKPVYVSWTKFLHDAEGWSKEQIDAYQLKEIQHIVQHAFENTHGYHALYERSGVKPEDIRTIEDFRKLPYVEKEMLRDRLEDYSAPIEGRTYITTGGSTGIPFGMYRDPDSFAKELASKAYQYYRVGWQEGDRQLVLRGLPIDTPDHMTFVPEFNELRCSSYHLTPEWMEIYRQKAWDYKPEWLRCYPSSGYIFARWLYENKLSFPPLKGILCASENLYDFQKEFLQKTFKTRVFSHYGHYELAVLAGYCETEDTYHVLPQYGYAELIGPDGELVKKAGGIGEVVATSFIMHATPFIRYRTRDIAILKGWYCPKCGRPYQIWDRIEGRLQEFIVTGSGRLISMTAINFHDSIFDHINQFQFYQEEKGKVLFNFIPKEQFSDEDAQEIKNRLLAKLGNDVDLAMKAVDDIPLTKRGKNRFLIQKIPLDIHDF